MVTEPLTEYVRQMSQPKPFAVDTGRARARYAARLRLGLRRCVGLEPLPQRIPLDVQESEPLDHPWATVRRVAYQLWPGVYSTGLLYLPKTLPERPAPAMLCPHGHWAEGNANPAVQARCLNFARLGYVVFSPNQNHYEDLPLGVSHQTVMIWTNMRALDYLQSLELVDPARLGAAGESGGGLQTQMLAALDPRLKAATIVGLTCELRELLFPDRTHCTCNHFPGVMRLTDHPEISALALPAAVQYLTMNDWTRSFRETAFPSVLALYAANGLPDRTECLYFDAPHSYDKPMREHTYRWMETWVRGTPPAAAVEEPESAQTFPVADLARLQASVPGDRGFAEISRIYLSQRGYRTVPIASFDDWRRYRRRMLAMLRDLLGEDAALPCRPGIEVTPSQEHQRDLTVERVACPSEGGLMVPTLLVHDGQARSDRRPVTVMCSGAGGESLLAQEGPGSPAALARAGQLVVLPDVRFCGALAGATPEARQQRRAAFERNGITWGRPLAAMAATDIRAVLAAVVERPDAAGRRLRLVCWGSGDLAAAGLFVAAGDPRVADVDLDFGGCGFREGRLSLVPFILQHGDVPQWVALLAERSVTLRNVSATPADMAWLRGVFGTVGNAGGLHCVPPPTDEA